MIRARHWLGWVVIAIGVLILPVGRQKREVLDMLRDYDRKVKERCGAVS